MPFPKVYGVPTSASSEVLHRLRADIITAVADAMSISPDTVRPFFPIDLIGDPDEGQDTIILVELGTGMFSGVPNAVVARKRVTSAVAQVVWNAYSGRYGVEVFVDDLSGVGVTYLKPKQE